MSVSDVAHGLVERCRQGDFMGAIDSYYSDDIVSVEPAGFGDMPAEARGIGQVRHKNEWWADNNEVHDFQVDGPFVGGSGFAVHYMFDITPRNTGERVQMTEVALYTVDGDKIVREEFFYNAPSDG